MRHINLRSVAMFTVIFFVIAMSAVVFVSDLPFGFDQDRLLIWVRSLENWGGVAIIALMIIHSFIPFPAEVVAFIAGNLFGLFWGTIFAWTGAMLGACLAFALSRALGRQFVVGALPQGAQSRLDQWSEDASATTLLVARLIPVIAFNLINYAAGLTKVAWRTFIWTTGIGILPLTVFFVYLGECMRTSSGSDWLVFLGGALLILVLAKIAQRAWRARSARAGKAIDPQQ